MLFKKKNCTFYCIFMTIIEKPHRLGWRTYFNSLLYRGGINPTPPAFPGSGNFRRLKHI